MLATLAHMENAKRDRFSEWLLHNEGKFNAPWPNPQLYQGRRRGWDLGAHWWQPARVHTATRSRPDSSQSTGGYVWPHVWTAIREKQREMHVSLCSDRSSPQLLLFVGITSPCAKHVLKRTCHCCSASQRLFLAALPAPSPGAPSIQTLPSACAPKPRLLLQLRTRCLWAPASQSHPSLVVSDPFPWDCLGLSSRALYLMLVIYFPKLLSSRKWH